MKARLPAVLLVVILVCLTFATTADAYRAPTEQEQAELTDVAQRYFDELEPSAPQTVNLRRIRVSTKDEVWASALTVTKGFSPIMFFKRSPGGEWGVDKASDGCLYPTELHMPAKVAFELGACKPEKPGKVFVRDSTGHFKFRPHTLHFDYEALFPGFKLTQIGHWKDWYTGSQKTWAKGWLHYDTCEPDCAEGRYVRRQARVTLSDSNYICDGRNVFDMVGVKPRGLSERKQTIACNGFLE